jgi:RNA recognition motif-containing protein
MSQNKIFVGNLSYNVNSTSLGDLFRPYGDVVSANVVMDRETGRSRGFGFVEMAEEDQARKAVDEMNGKNVSGRDLVVNLARPREESGNFQKKRGGYQR